VAGFGFDAAVWEMWPPLTAGATLVLPRDTGDVEQLLRWWEQEPLDISFLPTPLAEYAFAHGIVNRGLETLLIGGDRLRQLPSGPLPFALVNNYGPTESAVVATSGEVDHRLHIGRPIANTRIHIVDAGGRLSPIGVVGEILVSGKSVARGYLNRPELTAERFVESAGERMYRTGDLGRWLEDGTIEFLGRNDFQVKIRGYRIELGEIESRLSGHDAVDEAIVVAREERLIAYYVGRETSAGELREHLGVTLPEVMLPAAFVRLESMPLTANGKIDRSALPLPDALGSRGYEPPRGEIETAIAAIWAEVLQVERVGRNDNFFELGGHSLTAVTVIERMRQQELHIEIRALFAAPTLAEVAAAVEQIEEVRL
jgi:non-ribosomal peptide synthetase component F